MYDIVIVGAGPAGSTLARLIADKYKVLLIDKRDLRDEKPQNNITKCCGGLLAPDAQKMIVKLGLGIPKEILVDPQLFAVRTIDITNSIERLYQRYYLNMDREKFDRWLVSILPVKVVIAFNSLFKSFIQIPGGYEIKYINNCQELSARTKVIVGADGAFSRIRNTISKNKNTPKTYISIQEWFECPNQMHNFTAIFDEEVSDFYSWIIPKNNHILLGAALRPKDNTREKFEMLKRKLSKHGFDFYKKAKTEGGFIYRPTKTSQLYVGRDGIALVGEAAGAISPSSAEGISYAMKSALYLTQSLDAGIDGFMERYKQNVKDISFNLLLKNIKSPAMYNPLIRQMAMKSGFQSIK